jgi:hypothetical protein
MSGNPQNGGACLVHKWRKGSMLKLILPGKVYDV